MTPRRLLPAAIAIALAATTAAVASAPVTHRQAVQVTRRVASARTGRMGLDLPAPVWTVACYHAAHGQWRCQAGAGGGLCSAGVRVEGNRSHPRARNVRVYCFD